MQNLIVMSTQTPEQLGREDYEAFLEDDSTSVADITLEVNGIETEVHPDEIDSGEAMRGFDETVDSFLGEYRETEMDEPGKFAYLLKLYGTRITETPVEECLNVETDANVDHYHLVFEGWYDSSPVTPDELQGRSQSQGD